MLFLPFLERMFGMVLANKVIIVEDESAIAQLLKIHMLGLGLEVDVFADAESAFLSLQQNNYKICLLDWMLPGIQGIDFLKRVRQKNKLIKVMMVTAKADPESLVQGFEAGADDYLPKPFDAKVLTARVKNMLRRIDFETQYLAQHLNEQLPNQQEQHAISGGDIKLNLPEQITVDGLTIHFTKYFIKLDQTDIHLTPSEFKLLSSLVKAQGRVLTREELIDQIQGEDVSVTGRTIDTHVFALRKKLAQWSSNIETIRGVGYRVLISKEDRSDFSE